MSDPLLDWFDSLSNYDRRLMIEGMGVYAEQLCEDQQLVKVGDRLHDLAGQLERLLQRHIGHRP